MKNKSLGWDGQTTTRHFPFEIKVKLPKSRKKEKLQKRREKIMKNISTIRCYSLLALSINWLASF